MARATRPAVAETSPHDLINPLWTGSQTVALTKKDVQRVYLHYGGGYLHMLNGAGCYLRHRRVGPGVYDLWLERAGATPEKEPAGRG